MKLLLDAHAFLWFVWDDAPLSANAKVLIADAANQKFISPATYWEIAIKMSIGKLALGEPYRSSQHPCRQGKRHLDWRVVLDIRHGKSSGGRARLSP